MQADAPVVLNPDGAVAGLITVDHAGISLPAELGGLGLSEEMRRSHYFCDLGVTQLAEQIARALDVTIVLCQVSRLVVDVNRWIEDPSAFPDDLEGVPVPANLQLGKDQRMARAEAVFWPYHELIGKIWAQKCARHARPFFFALHSCTRNYQGFHRPWDGGTIWNDDETLSRHVLASLAKDPRLTLGSNQPYSGRSGLYTVDRHCHGTGLPACGFEVTNDQLETADGIAQWAARLTEALGTVSRGQEAA